MQRDYICCRAMANGATAFLVKEEDETVTVHAKFPYTASGDFVNEYKNIAVVPPELIDEIEMRPTWNFHMSEHLQQFADSLWDAVQKVDSWYVFN